MRLPVFDYLYVMGIMIIVCWMWQNGDVEYIRPKTLEIAKIMLLASVVWELMKIRKSMES